MADVGSAVAVLRWLVEQDHRQTPAYLVRTRVERAMLALAADISMVAYGERIDSIRPTAVAEFVRGGRGKEVPEAARLLREISDTFDEFVGFTDAGRYTIDGRHPNVERSATRFRQLADSAEVYWRSTC